jgi:hypothetical protein
VSDDLTGLTEEELEGRLGALRAEMRPLEQEIARLRADRDVLLTERRRRERSAHREQRASLKAAMREGTFPTIAELVAGADEDQLDEFVYNLKTGGEVRLGFPGARTQTLTFTDGVRSAQVADLAEAGRLYAAGWEHGSPGKAGVRVHFSGTRQERLVPADDVFARSRQTPA